MCIVPALEDIISRYPIIAIITSCLWQEDLVHLALSSKATYGALREYSGEYWRLLHSKARKGCKFEDTYEYNHEPQGTPTPMAFLSQEIRGAYVKLDFPELGNDGKEGVCVRCRDRICKGCTNWSKINDVLELSRFSPRKSDLLWRRVRHFCSNHCRDKRLAELGTKCSDLKICQCDVAPLKDDAAPWICPPCSYKNHEGDEVHNEFQEACLRTLRGENKVMTKKKMVLWEDFLDPERRDMWEEKQFCACGDSAKGVRLMVCSWCDGEVKLEW